MHVETPGARTFCAHALPSIGAPVSGTAADHGAVARFLTAVFQQPSAEEFASSVDDPFYDPADRILLKHGSHILAHAQLTWRTLHYGAAKWPLCRVNWLGVLPEYDDRGLANAVLDEVETQLRQLRPAIVELGCKHSPLSRRPGWAAVGRYTFSQASPRDVLAHLVEQQCQEERLAATPFGRSKTQIDTRIWRRYELPELMRIYRENAEGTYGRLQRTETYWQWLLARQAYDQIYVAVERPRGAAAGGVCDELLAGGRFGAAGDGSRPSSARKRTTNGRGKANANGHANRIAGEFANRDEFEGPAEKRIVAYAVVRNSNLVELMFDPGYEKAAQKLVERACRDAIERDHHVLRVHGPENSPLHPLLVEAGGTFHPREAMRGATMFVWLPDVPRHLARIAPELIARARGAGLELPVELGLKIGSQCQTFALRGRKAYLDSGQPGRSYIACDEQTWTRLLSGYESAAAALAAGRLTASTAAAERTAIALWPDLSLWRPAWDDLSA
ncbi:MAG: GNAT family N-acetyltransferase [Planctomycetota bacterium]|nr:MAG: GNAT family N-acetyltransferase [Planctomycetota bacterium]REK26296.1 MAG: GNAT family N-acetyltransferase [Planctomycetota bacterium]REK45847.1 MAG: GNAT family N-acetyltransferase [Planctomycetota bacterium]